MTFAVVLAFALGWACCHVVGNAVHALRTREPRVPATTPVASASRAPSAPVRPQRRITHGAYFQ